MKKPLSLVALFAVLALSNPALATSANGTRSGSSFGGGTPQSAASGGVSADGGASGNSFGSATIGTDRVNNDNDSDGVEDAQDAAPDNNTVGGENQIDTDNDGKPDSVDPTPTIDDGGVDTSATPTPTGSTSNVDSDGDGVIDGYDTTPLPEDANTGGTGSTGDDSDTAGGTADTDDSNAPDFELKTETNLANPNNPDPRLNNGTTADDAQAR